MTASLAKLHPRGAGFLAAEFIYGHDCLPLTTAALYVAIDFGKNAHSRTCALSCGISSGWLARNQRGDICITPEAVAYFDGPEAPTPKFQGQPATKREPLTSVYARPELSAQYKPNSKGTRNDVPDFSVRAPGHHLFTQA